MQASAALAEAEAVVKGTETKTATNRQIHHPTAASDMRGKHRILAELKQLEQEARSLQDELEELQKMEVVSVACQELLLNIDTRPDPLLPSINGSANPSWDRWFEGPQELGCCVCWLF